MKKKPSRLRGFFDRVSDRLGRSSHVFLVVLIVLCAVEVFVDWNTTLYEVNVLRSELRQKGENYADLLRKASERALLAYDWDELERLSVGVFEDDDVVYVRFSDVLASTVYDRLRPEYGQAFERKRKRPFREVYRRQMARDVQGMLSNSAALREKMERSRYVDVVQRFTDLQARVVGWFTGAKPRAVEPPRALYQDRLAGENGERDTDLTYALGTITAESGEPFGVVLVAFSNASLKRATLRKYLKGLAVTVFFVGLILIQNILQRRAKLRLLDLEAALKAAREAVRVEVPPAPPAFGEVGVALQQADRVAGTMYDQRALADDRVEVVVAVPEGSGVDAAFASVVLRDLYRRVDGGAGLEARARALLFAYQASPLARKLALVLFTVDGRGRVEGVAAGLPPPAVVAGGRVEALALGEEVADCAPVLVAPLRRFAGRGDAVLFYDDGVPAGAARRLPVAEALERLAERLAAGAQAAAEALLDEAVRRHGKKQLDDLLVVAIRPRGASEPG